jgi:hypothetical protein
MSLLLLLLLLLLPRLFWQLSALVLSKLLSSLPVMRHKLRSGYLLGDTRQEGITGGLAMNNKVGSWADSLVVGAIKLSQGLLASTLCSFKAFSFITN